MNIKVYGSGCSACHETYELVMNYLSEEGIAADLDFIQDTEGIAAAGVQATAAVIVDGDLWISGRIPRREESERRLNPTPETDMWRKKTGF
jgi:small redox-active disulfide protein 2